MSNGENGQYITVNGRTVFVPGDPRDRNNRTSYNVGNNNTAVTQNIKVQTAAKIQGQQDDFIKRIKNKIDKLNDEYTELTGENLRADNLVDRYAGKSKLNGKLAKWKQYLNTQDNLSGDGLFSIKYEELNPNEVDNQGNLSSTDKTLYYVQMRTLLNWIEDNILLYNKSTSIPVFKIDTGSKNYMLHFPKQISANPKVCIIPVRDGKTDRKSFTEYRKEYSEGRVDKNGQKEFIIENGNSKPNLLFDESKVEQSKSSEIFYGRLPGKYINALDEIKNISENFLVTSYIGDIMYLNVNLNFIASVVNDNIDLDGNLNFVTFMKEMLNGLKAALGYINNFELIYDKETNFFKILDNNVLKYGNRKNKNYSPAEFVVNGFDPVNVEGQSSPLLFGSFVENVNFTSMLDNKFASMVSIAAQSDTNVIGMDTTGLSRFNEGLIDRIIPKKQSKDEIENNEQGLTEDDLSELLTGARDIATQMYGSFRFSDSDIDIFMSLNRDIANYYVNQAVKKKEIPSPLVIPFNLSLQMMGLSGMRINERFDVSEKILPPMFDNNSYNFITKAVSHEIKGNKWTTTLESQIINKEDPKAPDIPISNADYSTFISIQNTSSSPIKGCPAWTPNRTGGGGLLTPNQVILDSLKEAKFITEATFASFKSTASPSVKFAAIIATQEGYGKTTTTGYKNNNPGNITGKGTAGSVTKTVTRGNKPETYTYAKYSTKKDGWDALINKFVTGWVKNKNLLPYAGSTQYPDCFATDDNVRFKQLETPIQENTSYNYKAKETPTLRQYLYQFCPPSSAGTDSTVGYISNVAKSLKEYGLNISSIDEPMTNYIT